LVVQLGCNTVLFGCCDLATALTHIAWAGYHYVELAAIAGMAEHIAPSMTAVDRRSVRDLLTERGLTATAIEAATTDRSRLEAIFGLANDLGIAIVNVGSGGSSGDEESTVAAIAHLADLADLAGRHGVRLAVKPHVGQAIYNAETAMRLVSEVSEPALGLNFDPSHLFRAGEEPQAVAHLWGKHVVTSHFRDCLSRETRVGPPETQIPGRGSVDIPATLRALRDEGYAGPLNLEVIGAAGYDLSRAMGVAAESQGYLHRCLQEISIET
jgi:sugar phosphate isomerase/epimerase